MKALSVQQPWADLIMRGKDVENRSWQTSYRGPLLIHAGATLRRGPYLRHAYGPDHEWELGGVVGIVDLVDCIQNSTSPWAGSGEGCEWHWILRNPQRVPFFPCKGTLGLFDIEWPPAASAPSRTYRREERPFTDVDALFERIVPIEEIARVLPVDALRAVVHTIGETPLEGDDAQQRAAFAQRYRRKLNTVLFALEKTDRDALLRAVGLTTRQSIDAWVDAIGWLEDDDVADDPEEDDGNDDGNDDDDDEMDADEFDFEPMDPGSVEVVKALGIKREPGFGYYFDDGAVQRFPTEDEDAEAERIVETGVVREDGFVYWLDTNGDLARGAKRRRHGLPHDAPLLVEWLTWINHDCGRRALAALCDIRKVPRRRSADDMELELARAYEGDLVALINDLPHEALAAVIGSESGICIKDDWWRIADAKARPIDELRQLAVAASVHLDTTGFTAGELDEGDDDDGGDGDENDGDDSNEGDAARVSARRARNSTEENDGAATERLRARLSEYTGRRSLELRTLLRKAEMGEFARLRTDRFQSLREMIAAAGFVLCDEDGTPFTASSASPGIDARVRLQPRPAGAASNPPSTSFAPESATTPSRTPSSSAPAPSDYEVAVARLRILTSPTWTERRTSALWPNEFIQLACDRPLEETQRRMLTLLSAKLADGGHSADEAAKVVKDTHDRGRLAALVDAYEFLNDGAADIASRSHQMRAKLGLV